jgi:glyoxylase-like metal-dependent hydrolase (beta-lactamase superfamily II)
MLRDPRQVRVLPVCHEKGCRSYVVVDPSTREASVVDPLLDRVGEIQRLLGEEHASLRWIVDTHSHGDHLSGAAFLRERTGAEVVMHPAAPSEVATVRPKDGERLPFGEHGLRIRHAPGNTPDSIVVEAAGALFTGDTLLIGTVGLRDVPGSDPGAWFETLHRIFGPLPNDTVLHPGHDDMGRTHSTMKKERTGNGWLRQDDLEGFHNAWASDARPIRKDAEALLEANRHGLQRVPREIEPASGLAPPSQTAEAQAPPLVPPRRPDEAPPPGAFRLDAPVQFLFVLAGGAAVAGTLLGWAFHPAFHGLAGLAGIVLLGLGLPGSLLRRRRGGPSLYYEGPARRTLGT